MQNAILGDELAFKTLYDANSLRLSKLISRLAGNQNDTEDLVSDTFILAFRKLHTFQGKSHFSTWIYRIAFNNFLMWKRKKKLETISLEDYQDVDIKGSVERSLSQVEYLHVLPKLKELPSKYLDALLLHEVYGFSHLEISKFYGSTIGTSKSNLYRARRKAKELLLN